VCSHGRTATSWLTRLLNQHPDIVASHGPTSPPTLVGRYKGRLGSLNDPILDPDAVQDRPIVQLRDELRALRKGRYFARVHTLSAFHAIKKLRDERPDLNVRVVNIVRHPVTRAESYLRHWLTPLRRARFETVLAQRWRDDALLQSYARMVERDFPRVELAATENAFFLLAVLWIVQDFQDFTLPIDHFACESLVSDPDAFRRFMHRTFGPDIALPEKLMRAHRSMPRLNTTSARAVRPETVYRGWEDWQRALFARLCGDAEMPRLYARFGYDFSFVGK
jgi:hypothetical protein